MPNELIGVKDDEVNFFCVVILLTAGNWIEDGCFGSADGGTFTCSCNHLTNFALLLSKEVPTNQVKLTLHTHG